MLTPFADRAIIDLRRGSFLARGGRQAASLPAATLPFHSPFRPLTSLRVRENSGAEYGLHTEYTRVNLSPPPCIRIIRE